MVNEDWTGLQWTLPPDIDVPPDELQMRLDFYNQAIVMHVVEGDTIQQRVVSAENISNVLARQIGVSSGFLPEGAIWWRQLPDGPQVAIWRRPQVTPVALQLEMFKPAVRLKIPMPGLLFLCSPGRPPWMWAMKHRPKSSEDLIYHAPCFNVFTNGFTCQGTHSYGQGVGEIPNEFFTAFFSPAGNVTGRSHKHPQALRTLWEELDGTRRYPNDDLVQFGRIADIMGNLSLLE